MLWASDDWCFLTHFTARLFELYGIDELPALAALIVVVLEIRSMLRDREQAKQEKTSIETIDQIMKSVAELLKFQEQQAKRIEDAGRIPDPSTGVKDAEEQ